MRVRPRCFSTCPGLSQFSFQPIAVESSLLRDSIHSSNHFMLPRAFALERCTIDSFDSQSIFWHISSACDAFAAFTGSLPFFC